MNTKKRFAVSAIAVTLAISPVTQSAALVHELPAGTKVFLALDDAVTSARDESSVGQVVRCHVWRDVEMGGVTFVKAATPATCKVDKIKRRNMGGIEGKISIAAFDAQATDGQTVLLSGGYNKEGSGRKAVVWTVGLLLLWPVLFVPGGAAELPPGTVFDATTVNPLRLSVDSPISGRAISLSGLVDSYGAEFLLDDFLSQKKPEFFRIKITKRGDWPSQFVVDNVNDKSIDPIPLTISNLSKDGETSSAIAEAGIKPLSKHFQKGINRFQVAYVDAGQRVATEVLVEVQM